MTQQTNDNSVLSAQNADIPQEIELYKPVEGIKSHNDVALTVSQEVVDRMWLYAEKFADSTLYKKNGLTRPADYFIAFGKGYELGIPLFQTFDYIYQVSGKLCTDGKGMIALLKMRPEVDDIEIQELENKAIVTVIMTNGRRYTQSFTQSEAVAAGLTGKEGWQKYPSAMRVWRAISKLVRFHLPHLVGGLLYTKEELEAVDTIKDPQNPKLREFNNYLIEVATDYDENHWFIMNPKPFVGILRRDVPQWKELSPLAVIKNALQTVDKPSWVDFASGRDAINAIKAKLGIVDSTPEPTPSNIAPLPTSANVTHANASANGTSPAPTFSNGEKLPPIEVDPLTITPVSAPKSDEPDPNDPEDIRHAIPIYGADHWYVKHYLAFVKLLREVVPNQDSMVNHEVSAEGLRLIGKPIWKDFISGASAITALKAKLGIKDTPTPPAPTPKPTSQPAPAPTPQPEANANWQNEFAQWLWDFLDIASIEQYEVMAGKQVMDYPTLKDATEDAIQIAQAKQWTICSYRATYVKKGEKSTYIEFQGLFPVRMYGRSTTFKIQVGEGYYTANGVDKWEANQTYKIEGLRIRWQRDQNGIAIASKVEPIQYELDEPPLDLTPEELEAMAKVDI